MNISKSTLAEYTNKVDYKQTHMNIPSIKDYRKRQSLYNIEENKSEEKMKMQDYLHQDNLERLGAGNIIN
jgi:hypothetical protein